MLSRRALLGTAAMLPALRAGAQAPWPAQPIRFVVPFPPGGLVDLLAPRPRVARCFRPHPARLAPLRPEKPIEEPTSRCCHPVLGEQGTNPRLNIAQRRRPQLQRRLDRCTTHRLTLGKAEQRVRSAKVQL